MKLFIIFIFLLLISIIKSSDYNLYSITANELGDSDPVVRVYSTIYDNVYTNSLHSLNGYIIQGISKVNNITNTITVLCNDESNVNSYLFEVDIQKDQIISYYPKIANQIINSNIIDTSYLFYGNQVFLPVAVQALEGLNLLVWDFDSNQDSIHTFGFNVSINIKVNPIGAIDNVNNLLYVAYQEKYSESTSIATFDLTIIDGSSSSSGSTLDKKVKTSGSTQNPLIKGLNAKDISLLYCDQSGDIYAMQSSIEEGVTVCKIDLINGVCNKFYSNPLPLNPNSFTYTPYFISENGENVITLLSKEDDYKSLLMTIVNANSPWTLSTSTTITNYWNSTGTLDYTFFAY